MTTTDTPTTRPAFPPYRGGALVTRYEQAEDERVPIAAADVLEAIALLRSALTWFDDADADLVGGLALRLASVAEALRLLYHFAHDWDNQTAHVPFHHVETVIETLRNVTYWLREGCEVTPGGYQQIAAEIALTHRLALALDAYDVAAYARADEQADAAQETPATVSAEAAAAEPATSPADVVSAFWTLSQAFKATGVNVEQVAHDAVAGLTPAT